MTFLVFKTVKRIKAFSVVAALSFLVVAAGLGSPAMAETPTEVVEAAAESAIYVGSSRQGSDPAEYDQAIAAAQAAGLNLLIVLPDEPQPNAKAFALRVRQIDAELDAVIVVGLDGRTFVSMTEDYSDAETRATTAAESDLSPGERARSIVKELTVEEPIERPAAYRRFLNLAAALLVVLAAVVVAEALWRQRKNRLSAA